MGKNSDIFIAFIGIVASSLGCMFAYSNILESESAANILSSSLSHGASHFQVMQGDTCVGEINTQLTKQATYILDSQVQLNLALQDQPIDTSISLKANFNPLGQMTDSALAIKSAILNLDLKTTQINPILYRLDVKLADKEYKKSGSLAGPITLKENSSNRISVIAPSLRQAKNLTLSPLASSIQDSMQLRIEDATPNCTGTRLDLAPLLELLKSQLKIFNLLGVLQSKGESK